MRTESFKRHGKIAAASITYCTHLGPHEKGRYADGQVREAVSFDVCLEIGLGRNDDACVKTRFH